MNTKVFIIGATGLLGKELLNVFTPPEFEVIALKRKNSNTLNFPKHIQWVVGDLEDPLTYLPAIQQANLVIHCAAKVTFQPKFAQEVLQFNVRTTADIVNACLQYHSRLLYVSSVAALGDNAQHIITEESNFDRAAKTTAYAKSKYFAELEVWRGIAEGLEAIIVNPSIILGEPTNWQQSSGQFWTLISNGLQYYPSGATGFVGATDVARAMYLLYKAKAFGEQFVINAENHSYKDVFTQIQQNLSTSKPLKPIPKTIFKLAYIASSSLKHLGIHLPFSEELLQVVNQNTSYSNKKLLNTIDVQFMPISSVIERLTEAYKQNQAKL